MGNQFLIQNAIALTLCTFILATGYIILLVKICNSLILLKKVNEYQNSDKILVGAIVFSFLFNLSLTIPPIYQIVHQARYSLYDQEFTSHLLSKSLYLLAIATLYSITALVAIILIGKLLGMKLTEAAEDEFNIGNGIFYGLLLIGISIVFKEHLTVLLTSMIQSNSVPIFN